MFGANYSQQIRDPRVQSDHQRNVGATDPSLNIHFEDFNLENNQPAFRPTGATTVNSASSPILTPEIDESNLGFGSALPNSAAQPTEPPKTYHFWNIEYYRFLFNVNTVQVGLRLGRSLVPYPPKFFELIHDNPDLYGPFWIATTLVFMMAATGNVAAYFSALRQGQSEHWSFDPEKLSFAAAAIYGYLIIIPLILFGVSKYYKLDLKILHLVCIYGYSLFIYVPISFLSVIPIGYVRWTLVGIAAFFSTSMLITNFFKAFKGHMATGFILLIVMAALHLGFALASELYFFAYSNSSHPTTNNTTITHNSFGDLLN